METSIKLYSAKDFSKIYNSISSEINVFKYFYCSFKYTDDIYFFVLCYNDKIIWLAEIERSPYKENTYWLSYLTILDKFTDMGFASKLSDFIIKWFGENNFQFETSSYSEQGFIKLKPLFNKLTKKYGVPFIDKEKLF